MKKKLKKFQLSAPSQLKQTLDYAFLPKVKNTDSRCKTRDATKKLYTEDIALVRKTQDAPENLSKTSTKRDNLQYPQGLISNEETTSENSAVTMYVIEENIGKTHHDVTSCQVYDKEGETTSITEPNNVNQDERERLNDLREISENSPTIKIDLVEYIKDCSKEQQPILSNDSRKNQKLLDLLVKRKKDTFTESSLVTLERKNNYQQLETSSNELTKFRSNITEGSFLSINKELQFDTSFTPGNVEKNVKNTNTTDKGGKLPKQLFQQEKCDEHNTNTSIDRDNWDFCLVCDNPGALICCDILPRSFHLKCSGVKKNNDVRTYKNIRKNHNDVTSCQIYDKECETKSIIEPNMVNQDERTRLNEIKGKLENIPDSKLDLVEYINECSKEQQQILSNDNRKKSRVSNRSNKA